MKVAGKVAIVTGAGGAGVGGLGVTYVRALAANGAQMEAGAYTVSKYAIDAVTRVLAAEFAEDNIRVNGIAPGMMTAKMPPAQVQSLLARQTVRRQGRPEDLVGALLYLCSDD